MPGNEVPKKDAYTLKQPADGAQELNESLENTGYKPFPDVVFPPPPLPSIQPLSQPPTLIKPKIVDHFTQSKSISILPPLPEKLGPHPNVEQNYYGTVLPGFKEVMRSVGLPCAPAPKDVHYKCN